jgi:hypothetical protein
MDLDQVYQTQVNKSRVSAFGLPPIERDPTILNLEKTVFQQMKSIIPEEPKTNIKSEKSLDVRPVSFEEALKELFELSKK